MIRALRYLRIAFSAACLIAAGLIFALSAHSNRSADIVHGKLLVPYELISVRGRLKLTRVDYSPAPGEQQVRSYPVGEDAAHTIENHVLHYSNDRGFGLYNDRSIMLPYWFVAVFIAALAGIPWIRLRFSLRTLLVATTLVAAALGGIVALSR
jgi:hypothetical protein